MTPTECILGGVNGGKLQIQVRGRTVSASPMSGVIRRHQCFRVEVSPAGEALPAVTCCQPFPISRYQAVCAAGGRGSTWGLLALSRQREAGGGVDPGRRLDSNRSGFRVIYSLMWFCLTSEGCSFSNFSRKLFYKEISSCRPDGSNTYWIQHLLDRFIRIRSSFIVNEQIHRLGTCS